MPHPCALYPVLPWHPSLRRCGMLVIAFLAATSLTLSAQDPADQIANILKQADSIHSINSQHARTLYLQAIRLADNEAPRLMGRTRMYLARYYDRAHKTDSARMLMAEIVKNKLLDQDSLALGDYYFLNASIYMDNDKIDLCGLYYDSAVNVFENLGEEIRLARVWNSMGIMYDMRDIHQVASEYYLRALAIFKKYNSYRLMGHIYNNLAGIYKFEEQRDICLAYYDSCERMYTLAGNKSGLADLYNNLGVMNLEWKRMPEAKRFNEKSIRSAEAINYRYGLGLANRNFAMYYNEMGDFATAEAYGRRALALAEETKSHFMFQGTMQALIKASEGLGHYKDAYEFTKRYNQWNDSVYSNQNSERVQELEAKYETQKKEKELAEKDAALATTEIVLQRQSYLRNFLLLGLVALAVIAVVIYRGRVKQNRANEELRQTNKQIAEQKKVIEQNLREKEGLLREIHHRVKNNLQVISSLLNMQSYHLDDPGMIGAIAEGQNRVKAMALIHQKLYQTDQLSEIDFQEYTEQLIGHLATAFGQEGMKVKSRVIAPNIKLDIDTAIPLGLILNELITNAYKYAFNGMKEGDLKIELQKAEDNTYQLRVADNGKGLPVDFDDAELNSLGLKLVNMLIEQLDGSLTVSNDHGASFLIRFKEARMSA